MLIKKSKVKVQSNLKLGKNAEEQIISKSVKEHDTDGTQVRCGTGITISANYNSVRIDCSVEFPTTKAKVTKAAEEAWDLVADELGNQMHAAQKLLKNL